MWTNATARTRRDRVCVLFPDVRVCAFACFLIFLSPGSSSQINRLTEDLRQNAPLDGNVYIAPEYHQAPHHYVRVSPSRRQLQQWSDKSYRSGCLCALLPSF